MTDLHDLLARWAALEPGRCGQVPLAFSTFHCSVGLPTDDLSPFHWWTDTEVSADQLACLQAHVQASIEARGWLWEVKRLSDGRYRVVINEPVTKEGTVFAVGNYAVPHPALAITAAYVAALEAVFKAQEVGG